MRIGVVTTSYPRWPGDGAGSFVANHVSWLRQQGHTVDVVAARPVASRDLDPRGDLVGIAAPGLFYGGGAFEALADGRRWPTALRFSLQLTLAVRRRAASWDAVCAHWLAPSAIAAALGTARPLLVVAHGSDVALLVRARLSATVARLLIAREARLAFVSNELAQRFAAALPPQLATAIAHRSIVQAMSPAPQPRSPVSHRSGGPRRRPVIALLARLVPIKGIEVAIDALEQMAVDAELHIAGEGPLRASLEARAARGGRVVRFVGQLRADDRDGLLAVADAVVVPSIPLDGRCEGMPLVALEAMSHGVPLVVSRTGGLAELPDPVRKVAPGDPTALAAALDHLLATPPIRAPMALPSWSEVGTRLWEHWHSPVSPAYQSVQPPPPVVRT